MRPLISSSETVASAGSRIKTLSLAGFGKTVRFKFCVCFQQKKSQKFCLLFYLWNNEKPIDQNHNFFFYEK
jgi:hypothetical protein